MDKTQPPPQPLKNTTLPLGDLQTKAITQHIETMLTETIRKDKAEGRVSWAAEHPEEYRANQYNSLVTKENADGIRNITQSHVSDLMHKQTDNKTDLNIEYFIQNMSKALPRTPSPRGK